MNEDWSRRLREIEASTGPSGPPSDRSGHKRSGSVPSSAAIPFGGPPDSANPFAGRAMYGAATYGTDEVAAVPAPLEASDPDTRAPVRTARFALLISAIVSLVCAGVGAFWLLERPSAVVPTPSSSTPVAEPPTASPSSAPAGKVYELLARIPVVPKLPNVPGYERSCSPGKGCVFGPAWTDVERTGCDTRNRVLARQLRRVEFKPGTGDCKVIAGMLDDPYSGTTIDFSIADPRVIEIDHVFALGRAWDAGASAWPDDKRIIFANDTENLLAVSGRLNQSKSDSGPDKWLPPNTAFVCPYVMRYLKIAAKYHLTITDDDRVTAVSACS